ncbi:MAG: hypothetical protein IJ246_06650 [Clostridia bacterium]|nr:hypothetical protein [Clostridia bacterium]
MRKQWCICLCLACMLALGIAHADSSAAVRRTVMYPGTDITLAIPAEYGAFYREAQGLTIDLPDQMDTAYVRVRVMPYEPGFDENTYFEEVWLPYLRSVYTGQHYNYLSDEGTTRNYSVGGRDMTGRTYRLAFTGRASLGWVLFDRWQGRVIRYEAYFPEENPDGTLLLLSEAVRSVTGSTLKPSASQQSLSSVDCPQQHFSFSAGAAYPKKFTDRDGMTVYISREGSIPYIMVYRTNDRIMETYEYLKEQYTPHMEEMYGSDLIRKSVYEQYAIGGKLVSAGVYDYMLQGYSVVMVRIMDVSDSGTVLFTAKYLKGEGAETMMALDAAVRSFAPSIR